MNIHEMYGRLAEENAQLKVVLFEVLKHFSLVKEGKLSLDRVKILPNGITILPEQEKVNESNPG